MPETWRIPDEALDHSMKEMAIDGAIGREGIAMWLGRYEGNTAIVSHIAVLRGPEVRKLRDQISIGSALLNEIADAGIEHRVTLIGQIHSHGPQHGVWLSPTDKRYGIAVAGYLSVIAPDYATRPSTRIGDCGVHLFENKTGWRRLSLAEVERRIVTGRGGQVPVLTIGSAAP